MHYPFTTEQLLELIEFVVRAIMVHACPSGDDSIVARRACQGPAPSLRTRLLVSTRTFCVHALQAGSSSLWWHSHIVGSRRVPDQINVL